MTTTPETVPNHDPFLTPEQVAEHIGAGVTPDQVRGWCRTKKIPSSTLPGGRRIIRSSTLAALLDGTLNPTEES